MKYGVSLAFDSAYSVYLKFLMYSWEFVDYMRIFYKTVIEKCLRLCDALASDNLWFCP